MKKSLTPGELILCSSLEICLNKKNNFLIY